MSIETELIDRAEAATIIRMCQAAGRNDLVSPYLMSGKPLDVIQAELSRLHLAAAVQATAPAPDADTLRKQAYARLVWPTPQ